MPEDYQHQVWPPPASPEPRPRLVKRRPSIYYYLRPGLIVGIAANLLTVSTLLPIFNTPAGTGIRPMIQACIVCLIAFAALPGALLSAWDIFVSFKERSPATFFIGVLGVLLCLSPLPLWRFLLIFLANVLGLHIEE